MTLLFDKMLQFFDEKFESVKLLSELLVRIQLNTVEYSFMGTKSFFSKIGDLLQNTEMFERPRKKIPGKWKLYEYFVDKGEQLIHLQADDLKAKNEFFEIEFRENDFVHSSTVALPLIQNIKSRKWDVHKNFISLIDESNFRNTVEFQFAFEKGNLKLLKKDVVGKIEFFGFFKRLPA